MAIPLLIIRLLPNPPTDAKTFQRYLVDLSINAYDRNVIDRSDDLPTGTEDVLLGTASQTATLDQMQQLLVINPPAAGRKSTLATPNSNISSVLLLFLLN